MELKDINTLPLFDLKKKSTPPPPLEPPKEVKATSTIATTLEQYRNHLIFTSKSKHTIEGFVNDIILFKKYIGNKILNEVGYQDLKNFIGYLFITRKEKPKSIERRVYALRNYFAWLHEEGVLPFNIALGLIYNKVVAPLPKILTRYEAERFMQTASSDPRDYLLAVFLLEKGVKRNELLSVKIEDIKFDNVYMPEVIINPYDRKRVRRVLLNKGVVDAYNDYIDKYAPREYLFEITERWINYILKDIAGRAGISKQVSCQILRDTCVALRIAGGEDPQKVLLDIGLSKSTINEETLEKFLKLAGMG